MQDKLKSFFESDGNKEIDEDRARAKASLRIKKPDISDYVLIESKRLGELKCGKCGDEMQIDVYFKTSPRRMLKNYKCEKCGLETWR